MPEFKKQQHFSVLLNPGLPESHTKSSVQIVKGAVMIISKEPRYMEDLSQQSFCDACKGHECGKAIEHWFLSLPPRGNPYHFFSHFIGQSKSHGHAYI